MTSTGVIGIASRFSIVPRSISRVTDSAVKISMVMVRMVPTRPGTMFMLDDAGRVVARVAADLERRRRAFGTPRSCSSAVLTIWPSADIAEPDATGSVASAATRMAGRSPRRTARSKPSRDLDTEQHLPRLQHLVEFGDRSRLPRERESRSCSRSALRIERAEVAVLLHQNRRRQVARRGVDGVAEQQELHQRHHHDHGERHTVALELDEFLDQHREGAPPESAARVVVPG